MTIEARRVSWTRGGALVVDDVSLRPEPGQTVGLLGPNGSGKSSLLRLLHGLGRPDAGLITLDGEDLRQVGMRAIARKVAAVMQHADTDTDITVRDVVRLGRTPHRSFLGFSSSDDDRAVENALAHVALEHLADRRWQELSGGERQRAHIARALAQEPNELLPDEPTNPLDIRHQLELLSLVAKLPLTSIVAMHDLNLAAMFCDTILVLQSGRVVAAGSPADVLTPELIAKVYGVRASVTRHLGTGRIGIQFEPEFEPDFMSPEAAVSEPVRSEVRPSVRED